MRKIFFTTAALLFSATSAFAASATVQVPGAHCQMCVQSLTDAFKVNESVKNASVDLKTTTMTLEFKDGKSLDDKVIQDGVKAAGFDAGKIQRM